MKKKSAKKFNVTKAPAQPEGDFDAAKLVKAVEDIQHAVNEMNKSRMSRDMLVALIHDKSQISKNTIKIVLNNLDQLAATWLKKV